MPIRLAEQHVRTLMEALPALCDAMECGELYTRKDGAFRIRTPKTLNCARLYHGKQCVSFSLADLRYMATMLHMVKHSKASIYSRRLISCRTPSGCWVPWCLLSLNARAIVRFSKISCLRNLSYSSYRTGAVVKHTHVISHPFPCPQLFVVLATLPL